MTEVRPLQPGEFVEMESPPTTMLGSVKLQELTEEQKNLIQERIAETKKELARLRGEETEHGAKEDDVLDSMSTEDRLSFIEKRVDALSTSVITLAEKLSLIKTLLEEAAKREQDRLDKETAKAERVDPFSV